MCGIAGFLISVGKWQEEQGQSILGAMAGAMVHRGPDDQGVWYDAAKGVGLAHRRLSIIDLSPGGHQPMLSGNSRFAITFNGEIYNYAELRAELAASGCRFRSTSDTEILLEAIATWGLIAACKKLVGMFAFAVYDQTDNTLWLVRDRMGKKPLYLYQHHGEIAFASELKALWRFPGFQPTLNPEALSEYFRHTYVADHLSIFNEVMKVMPGTALEIRPAAVIRTHHFWSLPEIVENASRSRIIDPVQAEETLLTLLRDATAKRMLADVPLGAFLSGGIDSGLVVSLMQESTIRKVRTFSIGFAEATHDEAPVARAVARHLGTDHTELYVSDADAQRVVPLMPEMFDEPFADASQIPTYLLAKLTRQHVTVALTGDGGDESFGGYARYRSEYGLLGACNRLPRFMRTAIARGMASVPPVVWEAVFAPVPARRRPRFVASKVAKVARALTKDSAAERAREFLSFWEPDEILRAGEPVVRGADPYACPASIQSEPSESMQYWETRHYLSGDLLAKVDRATMAASLEARSPLLDHRVVELAWQLPPDLKASRMGTKRILRNLLFRYVPPEIVDLPKQGFSVPIGKWMTDGLRDWVENALSAGRKDTAEVLNWHAIDAAWNAHLSARSIQVDKLWAVIMFCAWHDRWLGRGAR